MQLPTEIFGRVAVVHAPGELGEEHAPRLEEYIGKLEQTLVVIDLDGVESIDSRGLAALLNLQDELRGEQGDVRISTGNPVNRKILEITRLDQELEVFESVIEAVKSFS